MNKISNYDEYNYDYRNYWNEREYENNAEAIVLKKYFADLEGRFFLDIGGSFGRILEAYGYKTETPIIADYSMKTLKKYKNYMKRENPNVKLVAANAYYLPFKENTIDGAVMIRVLHHIENQDEVFNEVGRVLKKDKMFVLEYANKIHLKARIKWLTKFQFKNFSTLPYQQPSQGNFEGAEEGKDAIFLNYHPRYIKKLLKNSNFKILKNTNCSFFRTNFCKKHIPLPILIFFEKLAQKLFSWKNIAPSIILKTIQKKEAVEKNFATFEEILCCPKCKEDLKIEKDTARCRKCNKLFKQEDGIWDFRI